MARQKSEDLKALQAKWYAKLKDTGFEDIEQDEDTLKRWHGHDAVQHYKAGRMQSREQYYEMAGYFLYDHKFDSKFERLVWAHHAEGKTIRETATALNEAGVKTYKNEVHRTLQKLVKIMTGKLKS